VLVWDIETVPDLAGFAAANGHDGKSDDEIRAELGDKFPQHTKSRSRAVNGRRSQRFISRDRDQSAERSRELESRNATLCRTTAETICI
jgi:hypothetical protein